MTGLILRDTSAFPETGRQIYIGHETQWNNLSLVLNRLGWRLCEIPSNPAAPDNDGIPAYCLQPIEEPLPDLAAFLHARVSEQSPDAPKLRAKYHGLVDLHLGDHVCEDDDAHYAAGQRCPWIRDFVLLWRDHPQYVGAWAAP